MTERGTVRRPAELGDPPNIISYQSRIAWAAPAAIALMAVGLLLWFASGLGHPNAPVWFGLLGLASLSWLAFELIWRQARSVVVVNGTLYWTSWFKAEQVAIKDVTRMSLWPTGGVQVIECRDGRKLRVAIANGYGAFIKRLREAYPDLDIAWGGYAVLD